MKDKRGGVPIRKVEERLKDYDFIVPLFLKGRRFGEIATALQEIRKYPVDYKMVYKDMQQIMKGWKEERAKLMPAALEVQLRKLERMEATCWEQFEKSKTAKTKKVQKERSIFDKKTQKRVGDLTHQQAEMHVTENIGDGQWLDRIFHCWEMQAELTDMKNMYQGGGGGTTEPFVTELVFLTRTRKNNDQYTEAIEVPDDPGTIAQKLIQS